MERTNGYTMISMENDFAEECLDLLEMELTDEELGQWCDKIVFSDMMAVLYKAKVKPDIIDQVLLRWEEFRDDIWGGTYEETKILMDGDIFDDYKNTFSS